MTKRHAMREQGFGVTISREGEALLSDFERVGMWASAVLEAYLQGKLHRESGRSARLMPTGDDRYTTWCYTDGRCAYCGSEIPIESHPNDVPFRACSEIFTIDHFVPLANGGISALPNFVPCCLRCNGTKKDYAPETFFHARGPKLTWIQEAALAYYRSILHLSRSGKASFTGPPLWLVAGLVVPPETKRPRRKHRPRAKEKV